LPRDQALAFSLVSSTLRPHERQRFFRTRLDAQSDTEFQDLVFELLKDVRPSPGLNCTTRELAPCLTYAIRGFKEMAIPS
jgi:hypothetical protein